jgi:hypothetical protein
METGTTDAPQKTEEHRRPYEMPAWIRVFLLKEEIEACITTHPEIGAFEFFVPHWESIPLWNAAASQASLTTGKRIMLIYPASVIIERSENQTPEGEKPSGSFV